MVPGTGLCMGLLVSSYLLDGIGASLLCSALLSGQIETTSTDGLRWWLRPAPGKGKQILVDHVGYTADGFTGVLLPAEQVS